jgi:hypothetical protein
MTESMPPNDATAVWELTVICLLSCAGVALSWAHEADWFAIFFAAAAAISGEEAIRRSLASSDRRRP